MTRRSVLSRLDRAAYWGYVRVCLSAGVSPLSAQQWLMLTDFHVERHWRRWHLRITQFLDSARFNDDDDQDGAWASRKPPILRKKERETLWDVFESGLFIGELRTNGEVEPPRPFWDAPAYVRSQTEPVRGSDYREPRLTFRICRIC